MFYAKEEYVLLTNAIDFQKKEEKKILQWIIAPRLSRRHPWLGQIIGNNPDYLLRHLNRSSGGVWVQECVIVIV